MNGSLCLNATHQVLLKRVSENSIRLLSTITIGAQGIKTTKAIANWIRTKSYIRRVLLKISETKDLLVTFVSLRRSFHLPVKPDWA